MYQIKKLLLILLFHNANCYLAYTNAHKYLTMLIIYMEKLLKLLCKNSQQGGLAWLLA